MFNSEEYKKGFMDGVKYAKSVNNTVIHTAHWISEKHGVSHYTYICDHCYGKSRFRKSLFCPDCGYQMTEKGKSNNITIYRND